MKPAASRFCFAFSFGERKNKMFDSFLYHDITFAASFNARISSGEVCRPVAEASTSRFALYVRVWVSIVHVTPTGPYVFSRVSLIALSSIEASFTDTKVTLY